MPAHAEHMSECERLLLGYEHLFVECCMLEILYVVDIQCYISIGIFIERIMCKMYLGDHSSKIYYT